MPRNPSAPPLVAFAVSLAEVGGSWLEVRCCAGTTFIPLRRYLEGRSARTLGGVVLRLRCQTCHGRPPHVALVEDPTHNASGMAGASGWCLPLVGDGAKPGD